MMVMMVFAMIMMLTMMVIVMVIVMMIYILKTVFAQISKEVRWSSIGTPGHSPDQLTLTDKTLHTLYVIVQLMKTWYSRHMFGILGHLAYKYYSSACKELYNMKDFKISCFHPQTQATRLFRIAVVNA